MTVEGRPVALYANIGSPSDAEAALEKGAEGVGLFRTEFCLWTGPSCPQRRSSWPPTGRWRRCSREKRW